ncbi:hypothetical protein BDB00DRAFT_537893 [Zychaea mexicana]|uniref:uncharacterized protein n=1 Tax=Zychaea mexicana TaxID=64656 RepID=UPI0022FF40E8|nr:uncharacterized protein BDB00DRAFT_537893 [Zychaea mexicana]KAI9490569.1 hypothetical protein BDB00DRAFT_537893 [Zychaea mexicana]
MDRRHSIDAESLPPIPEEQQCASSSPRDIVSPTMSRHSTTTTHDLPSRSYFSSHVNYDPHTDTRYSASIDSIRAQSVALGDLYMTEDTQNRVRRGDGSAAPSEAEPVVPAVTSKVSNLSALLKHQNGSRNNGSPPTKHYQQQQQQQQLQQQQQDEESRPLLEHVDTGRTTSTQYHSISAVDSNGYSTQYPSHHTTHYQQQQQHHYRTQQQRSSSSWLHRRLRAAFSSLRSANDDKQSGMALVMYLIKRPLECIPAVILGLLLNLLDAISYGKNV